MFPFVVLLLGSCPAFSRWTLLCLFHCYVLTTTTPAAQWTLLWRTALILLPQSSHLFYWQMSKRVTTISVFFFTWTSCCTLWSQTSFTKETPVCLTPSALWTLTWPSYGNKIWRKYNDIWTAKLFIFIFYFTLYLHAVHISLCSLFLSKPLLPLCCVCLEH